MAEKVRHIRGQTAGDEHVLIVPGERDETLAGDRSRTYFIASPLISRTSRYRVPLRLDAVGRILEKERPDLIECGDPYQVAWKTVHSGVALGIPVVRFYHSHFPEAYIRTVRKFPGGTVTELFKDFSRRYIRARYSWERVFTRLFMLYREVIADYLRQGAYRRLDASRSQELGNESEKGRVLRASSIPRAATSQCGCSWRSDVIPQFGLSLRLLAHCVGIYLLCGYCRQERAARIIWVPVVSFGLSVQFSTASHFCFSR